MLFFVEFLIVETGQVRKVYIWIMRCEMKIFKLCIGMIVVFILTGCIGENYDFSPPAINLSSDSKQH